MNKQLALKSHAQLYQTIRPFLLLEMLPVTKLVKENFIIMFQSNLDRI